MDHLRETQLAGENIYDGKILHLRRDSVRLPNGAEAVREVIRHVGAVCIVALTDDGQVVTERQFRYPMDEVITEIPAGKLDSPGEDPLEAAKRELREETGATAERWTALGQLYPAAAYTDERQWIYLAEGLSFGGRSLDDDEFLDVQTMPLEALVDEIMAGCVPDAKTQAAVLRVWLLKHPKAKP